VTRAYINRVAIAVPEHEVHRAFVSFAEQQLRDRRSRLLFDRIIARSDIRRRWSCLAPSVAGSNESLDVDGYDQFNCYEDLRMQLPRRNRGAVSRSRNYFDHGAWR